jgi:hypothetical protein
MIQPLGPSRWAGFYRRSAIQMCGGFDSSVGDALTHLDLALSLRAISFGSRLETKCRVTARAPHEETRSHFASGLQAERLIWRHAPTVGWLSALVLHPAVVALEVLRGCARTVTWSSLFGRAAACLEIDRYRRHYRKLRQALRMEQTAPPPVAEPARRIDPAQRPTRAVPSTRAKHPTA